MMNFQRLVLSATILLAIILSIQASPVLASNHKPVSNAGPDKSAFVGDMVTLDGSQSSDVDHDRLKFRWSLAEAPSSNNVANSKVFIFSSTLPVVRFVPDVAGDYLVQLVVNDGQVNSDPDAVKIRVTDKTPPVNHAPAITSSPLTTATAGEAYSYQVVTTDKDNDPLTYRLNVSPSGMKLLPWIRGRSKSRMIQWTPTADQIGAQPVILQVGDSRGGYDSQNFMITVKAKHTLVPPLIGKARAIAEAMIKQAKLSFGTETYQHSANVTEGKVISQTPDANTQVTLGSAVNLVLSLGPDNGLPPNPATIAPRVDPTVATSTYAATQFLYTGSSPIQTRSNGQPLAQGTIDAKRAAVIRGKVLNKGNQPLPGVTVSILNHKEFGQTLSRADGWFDLAINGGGDLTVDYRKDNYLWAQRQVNVPWQDWRVVDDVVLIQLDQPEPPPSPFGLPNNEMKVAKGSKSQDDYGERRATLLFPPNTTAKMIMLDGSEESLTTLTVRATEYTVGENGPQTMPAELPPSSAYTYAVVFTADEAKAAGAKDVVFKEPIPFYVENFLNFPVGINVPLGAYDPEKGHWVAKESGKVIKIMSTDNGIVTLDTDTVEGADNVLNISEDERRTLADLYKPGQSLWRVLIPHFDQPYDLNWGWGLPDGATAPDPDEPKIEPGPPEGEPCRVSGGSSIECQNQILGEELPLTGTPLQLHYRSDRMPGHRPQKITIPLSGDKVPNSLKCIVWSVTIAARSFNNKWTPLCSNDTARLANQTIFLDSRIMDTKGNPWDEKNAYGVPIQGTVPFEVRVGYAYELIPKSASRFGLADGAKLEMSLPQKLVTIWHNWKGQLTFWDQGQALGGWSIDKHHAYDPFGKILYLGDGTRRSVEGKGLTVNTVAKGNLMNLKGIVVGIDGTVYFSDTGNHNLKHNTIKRIKPDADGRVSVDIFAGQEVSMQQICEEPLPNGNGIDKNEACLSGPLGLALGPDGSLYIADSENHRIRRVGTNGMMTTVAGTGDCPKPFAGFSGENGPAIQAQFCKPQGIALTPDGTLYFSDLTDNFSNGFAHPHIRRVGMDGIITTVAGNGPLGYLGDDGPALEANLYDPRYLAAGADGSLYVAELEPRNNVRRIGPDGIITTVAGKNLKHQGSCGGCLANDGPLTDLMGIALGSDGSLFINQKNGQVRRVGPDGVITTVAGGLPDPQNNIYNDKYDNGPATAAHFYSLDSIAVAPDGSLYVTDNESNNVAGTSRVLRLANSMAGLSAGDLSIASEDGSEIYQFNASGRHLRTLNALTRSTLYSFEYDHDDTGPLKKIKKFTDVDQNSPPEELTIERDPMGNPTALIAPFGQRTELTIGEDGYLTILTNPAGEQFQMSYLDGGLLEKFTDPNWHLATMHYDSVGRLISDKDAADGEIRLIRNEHPSDKGRVYSVDVKTAIDADTSTMERVTNYKVEHSRNGDEQRTNTFPDGTQTVWLKHTDGSSKTTLTDATTKPDGSTLEDGTTLSLLEGADPRFGMQAPIVKSFTTATGGLTSMLTSTRSVVPGHPGDPVSLTQLTDTVTLNGYNYTKDYDGSTRSTTLTTPMLRKQQVVSDEMGRGTLSKVLDSDLAPVNYQYDSGRLKSIYAGAGQDLRTVQFNYTQGNLHEIIDPLNRKVLFDYDLAGRVIKQTLPDTNAIQYGYDAKGNLTSITPPGRPEHQFTYTKADLIESYSPPVVNGVEDKTTYEYNHDKTLKKITLPESKTIDLTYNYEDAGKPCDSANVSSTPTPLRLYKLTTPDWYTTYCYDPHTGKLVTVHGSDGGNLAYEYKGALLTKIAWSGTLEGNVGFSYYDKNSFRLKSVSVNNTDEIEYIYDNDGLVKKAGSLEFTLDEHSGLLKSSKLNGVTDTLEYNDFGEVKKYSAKFGANEFIIEYPIRDKLGRIKQKKETVDRITTTYDYDYDQAGHLERVSKQGVRLPTTYGYDANGNRTKINGAEIAHYDAHDRLKDYNNIGYHYSRNGDLQTKTQGDQQPTLYDYDVLGNLGSVTLPNGKLIEYVIDSQNRRIGKKVNGKPVQALLYQDQLKPAAELDKDGNVVSRFVYATRANVPDYMIRDGQTYRIITDHLGSLRLVVNVDTGEVVQRIDYDAWGKVLKDKEFIKVAFQPLPFGFAGGLYDRDTGLVRFGARDYDAETGRWTAKDRIGFRRVTMNLYLYSLGDPINLIDPAGLYPFGGFPAENPPGSVRGSDFPDAISNLGFSFGVGGNFGFGPLIAVIFEGGFGVYFDASGARGYQTAGWGTGAASGISTGFNPNFCVTWVPGAFWGKSKNLEINIPACSGTLMGSPEGNPYGICFGSGPSIGADIHYSETDTDTAD